MLGLIWMRGVVGRRRGRVIAEAAGISVAVALIVAIGAFLGAAKQTMTDRSVSRVSVDWQVAVQPGGDAATVLDLVRAQRGVNSTARVEFGSTSGMTARTGDTTQTTGPGVAVGVPADYEQTFPGSIRHLTGSSSGALVAQQTAANLHAAPGTVVVISRSGLPDVPVTIAGVVDLPQADSFFQIAGAPPGSQPAAPPDNVVLLPVDQWHAIFDPLAAVRPDLVHAQIHARLDRHLPADPAAAFEAITAAAHNLEARAAGAAVVGDNLGAALDAARGDALYAQVLFLFLGLPGAVFAVIIAATIAASGDDRRRADAALLRTRGATTTTVVRLAVIEAACTGAAGAVVGVAAGVVIARSVVGSSSAADATLSPLWVFGAVGVGVAIAVVAIASPLWRAMRLETTVQTRRSRQGRRTTWRALVTALALLTTSAVVFNRTSGRGYNLILAPEGVTTISVSYWAFLGPALLWVGAGLLIWALTIAIVSGGSRALGRLLRPLAGELAPTVAAGMRRQQRLIARAVALVALTIAFAASTATFNDTYRHQSQVDALLTNGADVTVTAVSRAGLPASAATDVAALSGVHHVEPLAHGFAYVGTDLQDLYGVNPATIVDATQLQDSYFAGGSARTLMAHLATAADGLLVSAETVRDFQLQLGDRMVLRLESRSGGPPIPVTFHYIGVANEFPTAPRDSFLVANSDYLARATGGHGFDTLLVDTSGADTSAVATRARSIVGTDAVVAELTATRQLVSSSLTAVDLAGLTRIELGFSFLLIIVTAGLVLALNVHERRRTFAIASALGARPRHIAGFVWSESAFIMLLGLIVGGALAWSVTEMLVAVLTSVFDPPPESVTVPWAYMGALLVTALLSVLAATALAIRSARRARISVLRATA